MAAITSPTVSAPPRVMLSVVPSASVALKSAPVAAVRMPRPELS